MFRPMELWRHKNCLDIDILVLKIQFNHPDYVMAKVKYWNRHYKVFAWADPETVKILRSDFDKWSLVEAA